MLIRDAREADIAAITAIYNHAVLHTTAVYAYEAFSEDSRLAWLCEKQKDGWPVLVALVEQEVVGFGTYGSFRSFPAYLHTAENSVYVHPSKQQQGIGKELLGSLLKRAAAQGLHALVAGIDSTNTASIHLHQRFGFTKVAHFKEVGFKFGRWLDLVFMQKLLNDDLS
jgi:L-amino acid N-acyltransferase